MAYREIENKEMKFVNELILSKNNISEQLKLLRKYKDREDVQKYIAELKNKVSSNYINYLIERYFEGNKEVKAPKKTPPEEMFKLSLKPSIIKEKIKKEGITDIKVGDVVLITDGMYKDIEGKVEKVDNEYSEFTLSIDLFGKIFFCEVDFENVVKK